MMNMQDANKAIELETHVLSFHCVFCSNVVHVYGCFVSKGVCENQNMLIM